MARRWIGSAGGDRTGVFMAPFVVVVVIVQRLWPGVGASDQAAAVLAVGWVSANALWHRYSRPLAVLVLGGAGLLAYNLVAAHQVWLG